MRSPSPALAVPAAPRARRRPSPLQLLLILCLLLAALALASASSGAVRIPLAHLADLWRTPADPQAAFWRNVLLEVRLPRVVFAIVVGSGLAISGAVMQALFRNPLAEPGLIGVSLGGALGAVGAIVLGAQSLAIIAPAAFVGSLLATGAAYRLGTVQPGVANLLLAGVAINAICASVIGVFTYQATDVQLRNLTFWNMGSLAGANWSMLAWLTPWVLLLSILLIRDWRALNALLLGEREAQHLGFALRRLRHRIVILCALLVGPLVAVAGTISFIGLVVPHLVRLTQGADHRWLLPITLAGGALVMTLADWLARMIVMPAELPIGIITAFIGGPFLLWLLTRRQG
ncbi:MAG: iron ABC transporter [Candidatus Dactylopiibacterium carminicum]|uniref:Iron ABC transporter n=1 Tax=Candidatus Dactylopiibacterium carminicum TaxID=857335 RepID=A0A272ESK5_9RHOO|nr:iron ABC transporter permease [Candidatus Dactylopiibacterium carminicum]KAF7599021.1 iron ABC transporter permease [Candidatus Dactylopiibacterium carminicum]PAS93026.1 MAG: iron ABC transporter [Candidatus Dactylopiibacterium carminicum]PAS96700.1 MAG: iron ABC transporter [Candidatus Dactylopiibacterium carminicum]PAS99036.1 MAG: iron ABC transporter [Candidatus Dactylopiibacterium carminicum]